MLIGLPMLTFAQVSPLTSRTQLGVAHIGGLYSFSETDYLNEGAAAAHAIGARCIKVSLSLDTDNPSPKLYPFHSAVARRSDARCARRHSLLPRAVCARVRYFHPHGLSTGTLRGLLAGELFVGG